MKEEFARQDKIINNFIHGNTEITMNLQQMNFMVK